MKVSGKKAGLIRLNLQPISYFLGLFILIFFQHNDSTDI
jgi:hypothetical protein